MLRRAFTAPLPRAQLHSGPLPHACALAIPRGGAGRRSLFSFGSKQTDVEGESKALHNDLLGPLNARLLGPLEKFSDQLTPMPLVFVLGNHSRPVLA